MRPPLPVLATCSVLLFLPACGTSPTEPAPDLLARLTADGSATFALAQFESQRGAWIERNDMWCDAAGTMMRSWVADTVTLHPNGKAERVHRIEYDGGPGSVRSVSTGRWEPYTHPTAYHYSEGPSIRLSLTLSGASNPSDLYFRVHSASELSTHTWLTVGQAGCPNTPGFTHNTKRTALYGFERL